MKGEWQIKNEKLRPYKEYLSKLVKKFNEIKFAHMGRDKNQFVDTLSTLAFMAKIDHENSVTHKYWRLGFSRPLLLSQRRSGWKFMVIWYQTVYLTLEVSPQGIQYKYENLVTVSHRLLPWCKSVIQEVVQRNIIEMFGCDRRKKALKEAHEGICASHASGYMTVRQIQSSGYFWKTMKKDCIEYVKKMPQISSV